MPSFCLILNCFNDKKKCPELSFCRVPKIIKKQGEQMEMLSTERRRRWLSAISRDDLTDNVLEYDRVCGAHFQSGKAAFAWDKFNVDWVPTLNLGHTKSTRDEASQEQEQERFKRAKRIVERRKREHERELEEAVEEKIKKLNEPGDAVKDIFNDNDVPIDDIEDIPANLPENLRNVHTQTEELHFARTVSTQTKESHNMLQQPKPWFQPKPHIFDEVYFEGDDVKVKFYTGLPSLQILQKNLSFVEPHVNRRSKVLSTFQEFVLVLVKLRLAVPHLDLAYRFNISSSMVSRILSSWLTVIDVRLSPLISWPDREDLQKTMPRCFLDSFGQKTTVIIDCFEVFIDRPSNLLARAQTFSNYKHHNTVKVLIGITPQGTISFVSEAWGGRTSDKFLTENCGFFNNLLPGDLVLADRGFTIHEGVCLFQADLNIPAFTKGKSQLDPIDVETTRKIANVRIHVERVIGTLRQKYTILQSILPLDYLICNIGENVQPIDRMIRVCSALVNLCPPIVPFD